MKNNMRGQAVNKTNLYTKLFNKNQKEKCSSNKIKVELRSLESYSSYPEDLSTQSYSLSEDLKTVKDSEVGSHPNYASNDDPVYVKINWKSNFFKALKESFQVDSFPKNSFNHKFTSNVLTRRQLTKKSLSSLRSNSCIEKYSLNTSNTDTNLDPPSVLSDHDLYQELRKFDNSGVLEIQIYNNWRIASTLFLPNYNKIFQSICSPLPSVYDILDEVELELENLAYLKKLRSNQSQNSKYTLFPDILKAYWNEYFFFKNNDRRASCFKKNRDPHIDNDGSLSGTMKPMQCNKLGYQDSNCGLHLHKELKPKIKRKPTILNEKFCTTNSGEVASFPEQNVYKLSVELECKQRLKFRSKDSFAISDIDPLSLKYPNYEVKHMNLFIDDSMFSALIRDQDATLLFPLPECELYDFVEIMTARHELMFSIINTTLSKQFLKVLYHKESSNNYLSQPLRTNYYSNTRIYAKHPIFDFANLKYSIKPQGKKDSANDIKVLSMLASLTGQHEPQISISSYLARIIQYGHIGLHEIIIAFILISRILNSHPSIGLFPLNSHRLILTACTITTKIYKDAFYANSIWAKVGGITTKEMNILEANFLKLLGYRTHVFLEHYSACFCFVKQAVMLGKNKIQDMRTKLYTRNEMSSFISNQPYANLLFFQPHLYCKQTKTKCFKDF